MPSCSDCPRPAVKRGFCDTHYRAARRGGRLSKLTPADRFAAHVAEGPVSEHRPDLGPCLLWTGSVSKDDGYGRLRVNSEYRLAHREAWERENGPTPDGMVLDHLCRIRACVRPSHLEPVTDQTNIARGVSPSMLIAKSGICKHGHDTAKTGWRHLKSGKRKCAECHRAGQREYAQRKRLERASGAA